MFLEVLVGASCLEFSRSMLKCSKTFMIITSPQLPALSVKSRNAGTRVLEEVVVTVEW